uniref:Uncharacterized protein n=1 Tax=Acrobeloides nanus TaxID=290746 RepID=A0A914DAN5_9BILA
QENAQSSSTIDLGPSRELDVFYMPTSKSDSHLRYLISRPKTPCFGEPNPGNREDENLIEVLHSTASTPIEDIIPNSFVRQSKSLTFPGEIYTRAISSDDEGLMNHYHRCDSPACQTNAKEIYEKKFGSTTEAWDENSDDDIVLGDLKVIESHVPTLEKSSKKETPSIVSIEYVQINEEESEESAQAAVENKKDRRIKIPKMENTPDDEKDNMSMLNNPRMSICSENDEENNHQEQEQDAASVKTFTVEDDDIPMADDPSVESPISDFIVK